MALIAGSNAFDTPFTPAVGDFRAEVVRGTAQLVTSIDGTDWTPIRAGWIENENVLVNNPVDGVLYKWVRGTVTSATLIRANQ